MKSDDIILMERPASRRPKMSVTERAAQFSSFEALTGLEEQLDETARQFGKETELSYGSAASVWDAE